MAETTLRAAEAELFPAQNDTDNHNVNDVVGNKTDAAQTTVGTTRSIIAYVKGLLNGLATVDSEIEILSDHIHGVAKVYPTLAAGVTVTSAASAWTLGNYASVVAANVITSAYDIHGIKVEAFNTTCTYELVLYSDSGAGADYAEIGRCRITRDSNQATSPYVAFMSPIVTANKRISAKVANNTAGAATITISLMYHTY